jgi:hypothetical protein
MIKKDASLTLKRLPLNELAVYEYQERYPDRVTHYVTLLKGNTEDDLGVIHVKPRPGHFEILDGHHRFVALILMGRRDALCLIIDES